MTSCQCARDWISALNMPDSVPTVVRVTPDSQVCMLVQKTLQQLTQEEERM